MTVFDGSFHVDMPVRANQQELIYLSSVRTPGVVWKPCQDRYMIGTDGERVRESVLALRFDDHDEC